MPRLPSKVTLTIELGNDDMQDAEGVLRVLAKCALMLADNVVLDDFSIRDTNGNTVGKFEVSY